MPVRPARVCIGRSPPVLVHPAWVWRLMPIAAVTFDATGTLLQLEPPAPILTDLLADAGFSYSAHHVAVALDVEMRHFREHLQIGCDAAGLGALRAQCGTVLAQALGPAAPPASLATDLLVQCMRFRLYDDVVSVLDTLRDLGIVMGVVSNWDFTLPRRLADLGVADRFSVITASASVGVRKPDPAIFRTTLDAMGISADQALHVGDRQREDVEGARTAGLTSLLLDRSVTPERGDQVITTLLRIPGYLRD